MMENKKNKKRKLIFIIVGIALVALIGIFSAKAIIQHCVGEEKSCNDIYLGVCLDDNSPFYLCNVDVDMCRQDDYAIVTTIKYMEENNVVIYGSSRCGYCQKQLEEFNDFVDFLYEKELYVDCANSLNKEKCADVQYTPTWKKNGKIIDSGYRPIEEIIDFLEGN